MIHLNRKRLLTGFVSCLLILLLFYVTNVYIGNLTNSSVNEISKIILVQIVVVIISIYFLSAILWRTFFSESNKNRSFLEVFIDIGLLSISKYVPGKLWGILLRGSVNKNSINVSKQTILLSVSEQLVVLAHGLQLTLLLAVVLYWKLHFFVVIFGLLLTYLTSCILLFFAFKITSKNENTRTEIFILPGASTFLLPLGYYLLWILTATPLLLLASSFYPDFTIFELASIAMSFIGSMLAGWIAFFSPAGVGVRESFFTLLSGNELPWKQAVYLISLHRIVVTACDIIYGFFAITLTAITTGLVLKKDATF